MSLFNNLEEVSQQQQGTGDRERFGKKRRQGEPRLLVATRDQLEFHTTDLKSLQAQDHKARLA